MRSRQVVPILVLVLVVMAGNLASAANLYPTPLPDFSHPHAPHQMSGLTVPITPKRNSSPLLVVYGRFSDRAEQNLSEAQIEAMFFPEDTFGTVVNYFKTASGHSFELVPAQEQGGEVNNGVVVIELGESGPFEAMNAGQRRQTLLDRADAVVDFAAFDVVNPDANVLTGDELAIVTMYTSSTYTCGQTASVADGASLDGHTVAFQTVEGGTTMNMLTYAHEIGHQHMGMTDFYGFGAGSYDLAGPTCAGNSFQLPAAWLRLHWWPGSAMTVTQDGYYEVNKVAPDEGTHLVGLAYLLYDPERGVDDYFLIENRQREPGYDQNVVDSGLIIWRIDERQLNSALEHIRPVEIIRPDGRRNPGCRDQDVDGRIDEERRNSLDDDGDRLVDEDIGDDDNDGLVDEDPVEPSGPPIDNDNDGRTDEDRPDPRLCYDGDAGDAWDPSDFGTPQRTMTAPWADGTPSRLAVRAIPASSDRMWVYLDVRGPGVLIDPTDAQGRRFRLDAPAGVATEVSFPVMNTGEATDTFTFTVVVPSGWTATTQTMTLAAGQQATARITVTPPATAATGRQIVVARGQSTSDTSIRTDAQFDMVVKWPVSLQYTGDTTAEYSDPAQVSARVIDGLSGVPLAGRAVTFAIGSQTVDATTDSYGMASAPIVLNQRPGTMQVSASIAADDFYARAEDIRSFTIDKEDLTNTITSPLLQSVAGSTSLSVLAVEDDDGASGDLTLASVRVDLQPTLTTAPYSQQEALDNTGAAVLTFTGLPSDLWSVSVTLLSDYWEAPVLATELVVYDPAAKIDGFASGNDQAGERVKLTPVVSYSDNAAVGTIEMHSKPNKFKTTEVRWVVVAGQRALVEALGALNDVPAVLRSDVRDSGLAGGEQDRFSLRITSPAGTLMYQSGDVQRENGDLLVSGSQ